MKPKCKMIGENGNIFNLMALAARALKEVGKEKEAEQMQNRITKEARSYTEALGIIAEYVDPV